MKLFKCLLTLFVIFLISNHCYAHDRDVQNSDSSGASDEENSNDVQSEKRGITGSKQWDKVVSAFRETVIRSFLQFDALAPAAKKLFVGHPIGMITIWVLTIVEAQDQEISAWDAVQEKTDQMISERLTDDRLASLQSEFELIQSRMKKIELGDREQFGKADLRYMRAKASKFFPQSRPVNAAWTIKWCNVMWKYLTMLAAAYLDLMHKRIYGECKLAEEIDELRPQMIIAAKKMVKSRYKNLDRNYNSGDRRDIYHSLAGDPASLSFSDIADQPNDDRYHYVPISHVKRRVLEDIKLRSSEFLNEHLIKKFNSLYNKTWTPKSCNAKGPIALSELEFDYPQECMGQLKKNPSQVCTLPCGNYGGKFKLGQNWCVYYPDHNIFKDAWTSEGFWSLSEDVRVFDCELPEWEECMKTPKMPPIKWEADDYDKKEKKKGKDK